MTRCRPSPPSAIKLASDTLACAAKRSTGQPLRIRAGSAHRCGAGNLRLDPLTRGLDSRGPEDPESGDDQSDAPQSTTLDAVRRQFLQQHEGGNGGDPEGVMDLSHRLMPPTIQLDGRAERALTFRPEHTFAATNHAGCSSWRPKKKGRDSR